MNPPPNLTVVHLGATGAVGSVVVQALLAMPELQRLSLLGRRPLDGADDSRVEQHTVDIFDSSTYAGRLKGHQVAICTLGVGQPSKISREDFLAIDRDAVLAFATACREAGVEHFQLLSSVGTNSESRSFYLRTKGELEEGLKALGFARLSLFRPSMILTPTSRYGFSQAVTLKVWPWLSLGLFGPLSKFRGVRVEQLGRAIAANAGLVERNRVEVLHWDEIKELDPRPAS